MDKDQVKAFLADNDGAITLLIKQLDYAISGLITDLYQHGYGTGEQKKAVREMLERNLELLNEQSDMEGNDG